MKTLFAVLAAVVAVPTAALAQKPVVKTEAVEMSATIEAIDHDLRLLTLKDTDGEMETIYAGPEVKRFKELKVGDTITLKYYESVAFLIRKPGDPGSAAATGKTTVTRGTGDRPSATMAKQESATVTIKSIDAKAPAITVLTEDGKTASFRVDDKKHLDGVSVGDKVEVTFTKAYVVSVK